jgi:hypothetical protein
MVHFLLILFIFPSLLGAFLGGGRKGGRKNEVMEGRVERLD